MMFRPQRLSCTVGSPCKLSAQITDCNLTLHSLPASGRSHFRFDRRVDLQQHLDPQTSHNSTRPGSHGSHRRWRHWPEGCVWAKRVGRHWCRLHGRFERSIPASCGPCRLCSFDQLAYALCEHQGQSGGCVIKFCWETPDCRKTTNASTYSLLPALRPGHGHNVNIDGHGRKNEVIGTLGERETRVPYIQMFFVVGSF